MTFLLIFEVYNYVIQLNACGVGVQQGDTFPNKK